MNITVPITNDGHIETVRFVENVRRLFMKLSKLMDDDAYCRCACHSHKLAKESGFVHDALCCDRLNGSLETPAIQALLAHTLQTYKDEIVSGLPKILTEESFEQLKKKYPELDKTDFYHHALDEVSDHIHSVSERRGIK